MMSISTPDHRKPQTFAEARASLATPLSLLLTDNADTIEAGETARLDGKLVSETDAERFGTTGDVWLASDDSVWMHEREISLGVNVTVLNVLADDIHPSSSSYFGDPLTAGRVTTSLKPVAFALLELQESDGRARFLDVDVNIADLTRNAELDCRFVHEIERRAINAEATHITMRTDDHAMAFTLQELGYKAISSLTDGAPYVFRRML